MNSLDKYKGVQFVMKVRETASHHPQFVNHCGGGVRCVSQMLDV